MIPYTPTVYWDLWLFKLPVHGFFALLGIILGFIIVLGTARKQKIAAKIVFAEGLWVFIGAWLGSKLLYYLGPYEKCYEGVLHVLGYGFVFYGGLIGGLIAVCAYAKIRHYNFWKHADFWSLGIPLGIFIARIGCFMVNDALGKITSFRFAIQLADGALRHPAALYLSLFNLALFAYLYSRKSHRKFTGQIFLQYLLLYSAGRFLLEFLREYSFYYLGLTFSQWVSILVFAAASIAYITKSRKI